jgi:hypothetical protein
MNEQNKQRDRPGFLARWGADLLLVVGAAAVCMGAGMIYLPAGVIAGGVACIIGGVLTAMDGGGET